MHNDILPAVFAVAGIVAACRCGNFPLSSGIALALQAIDAVRNASGEHPDILNLTFHRQPNDGGVIVQLRMSNDDTGRAYH